MSVCNLLFIYIDVDECMSDSGGCDHTCQNTAGSYQCFCHRGHRLAEDKHSCIREFTSAL